MNYDNQSFAEVLRVAREEVFNIYKVDIDKDYLESDSIFAKSMIAYVQTMTYLGVLTYHNSLRDELLKHGIDIGKLNNL